MFATILALALLAPLTTAAQDPVAISRQAEATDQQAPVTGATAAPDSDGPPDQLQGPRLSINDAAFLRAHPGQRVGLSDEHGAVAMGRVVRTEGGVVIVRLNGRDVAVPASHVERLEMEGDSSRDGAVKGFIVGTSLVGMVLVDSALAGDDVDGSSMISTIVTTTTIGFIVDFLTPGHETVLVAPHPGMPTTRTSSAAGAIRSRAPDGGGRRVALRYRLTF